MSVPRRVSTLAWQDWDFLQSHFCLSRIDGKTVSITQESTRGLKMRAARAVPEFVSEIDTPEQFGGRGRHSHNDED